MIWKKQPVSSKLVEQEQALNTKFFTEVASGTDLNNLTTPGFYGVKSGAVAGSLSNSPITNTSFAIIVQRKSGSYISQLAYSGDRFYMRSQYSSGFQNWSELALNSDITSLLGPFARYANDFTSVNPGKIDDVITALPNNSLRGFVIAYYNGYTFANSASVYLFQRSATKGDWYGANQIYKGSESRTVTISNDGTVTKGETNAYNVRLIFFKISD